jgi:hypothetical protein
MHELIKDYLTKQAKGIPFADAVKGAKRFVNKSPLAKKMLQGGAAGGAATLAVMPIDTISDTQKQWRNTKDQPELTHTSKSFLATAKELAHPKIREGAQGGVSPFYAGAGGKLLKVIPSMALTFAGEHKIEELLKR